MKIQQTPIKNITPYEQNAKKHPKKQIKQIAASIENFGFNQPIVVDEKNVIIAGHGRYFAAQYLNLEMVPTYTAEGLTEDQVKAYRLADNKIAESGWEMDKVIAELEGLTFDLLDLTGFDRDLVLKPETQDDVIPEIPAKATSKLGQIYQLGDHRLMVGDSTKPEDVLNLMGDEKADCVFTDPPYNVNYSGRGKNTSRTIENDNMSKEAFSEFLEDVFQNYAMASKKEAAWYVFHSTSTQSQFQDEIEKAGWLVRNQIIWNKPVASMGWGDYRWKHEPMYYATNPDAKTPFYGDRTHTTIWDFHKNKKEILDWIEREQEAAQKGLTTVWNIKRDNVNEYSHPTQKPVEIITKALSNSTQRGDLIIDLFGGSGSTLIGAEKADRRCYTMEMDPIFADVIIKRWEEYTGENAKLIK